MSHRRDRGRRRCDAEALTGREARGWNDNPQPGLGAVQVCRREYAGNGWTLARWKRSCECLLVLVSRIAWGSLLKPVGSVVEELNRLPRGDRVRPCGTK